MKRYLKNLHVYRYIKSGGLYVPLGHDYQVIHLNNDMPTVPLIPDLHGPRYLYALWVPLRGVEEMQKDCRNDPCPVGVRG